MEKVLAGFITQNLKTATDALLKELGIKYHTQLKNIPNTLFFETNAANYEYIREAKKAVNNIWDIGFFIDESTHSTTLSTNDRYFSMRFFACEIDERAKFTRSTSVALTRAFNRVSSRAFNNAYDLPSIVIMLQGDFLSIATCVRTRRNDGKDKIEKVTILRNINCRKPHRGHIQTLERIAQDVKGYKSPDDLYARWLKSFSIDIINKRFFEEYREVYNKIVRFATGKAMVKDKKEKYKEHDFHDPCPEIMSEFSVFPNPDKAVRDYVKKLMGRIVFIHFLQKKGWMGVPDGSNWTDGDPDFLENLFNCYDKKECFIDNVLKPIFNDINTNRIATDYLATDQRLGKIPYLNGGLFEEDEYDKIVKRFPLDEVLVKDMFDFFSKYNFTIYENAPDDVEIGVDPEMLGRIFESLLEDNNDKGAFYTPKDIVENMCREALIAYLQTGVDDENTRMSHRTFVTEHNISALRPEEVFYVDKKLRDVKICDPAIGSGAFPMGMLRELFDCRMLIEHKVENRTPAEIKKDIIQHSIYGVDIEKGAVDIARLRFWLSLIVDEATPHTLPNLDFKIVQGNSLLEEFEGVNLSGLSIDQLNAKKAKRGDAMQLTLAMDEQDSLDNIQKAINQYYLTENHELKEQRLSVINDNVKSYIRNLKNCTPDIQEKLNSLSIPNDKFFLWHIYFKEVFDEGGFDIVIGNPPYIVYEGEHKGESEIIRKNPEFEIALGGKMNAYKFFLAHALTILVKQSGIVCFIFQNSFLADREATALRRYTISNCRVLTIDSFPERDNKAKRVFESVKMSVCVVLIRNERSSQPFVVNIWDDRIKSSGITTSFTKSFIDNLDKAIGDGSYMIPRCAEEMKPILEKMLSKKSESLILPCYEGELNVSTDKKKGYFSTDSSFPIIMKGAGIQRYYYTLKMSQGQIEYLLEDKYLKDVLGEKKKKTTKAEKALHHNCERLVMQGMTGANDKVRLIMTILPKGIYLGHSCKYIMPIRELPLKCILGILNSKIANAFFRCFSTNSNVNCYEVSNIPIPSIPQPVVDMITEKVSNILSLKAENNNVNTTDIEQEIDHIVYELYGLTNKEVRIIDPGERIVGEDSELFIA